MYEFLTPLKLSGVPQNCNLLSVPQIKLLFTFGKVESGQKRNSQIPKHPIDFVYNVRSILEYQRRTTFSNDVPVKNAYPVICQTETWLTESIGDAAHFLTN